MSDLIERLKQQKQQEILGLPAIKPSNPTPSVNKPAGVRPPALPLLWSISGINNELEAVLMYQDKAYVITQHKLPSRVGPWLVEAISAQGVVIRSYAKPQDPPIEINAPSVGSSIEPYANRLGLNRNSTGPVDLMGSTSQQVRVNSATSSAFSAQWTNNESASVLFGTVPSYPAPGPLPNGAMNGAIPFDQPEGAQPKKP